MPAGSLTLPLELLEYNAEYHTAMVRAFGGSVIAADDATAARLVTEHGLACITLDGKVSRPGSMQVMPPDLLHLHRSMVHVICGLRRF